MKEYDEVKADLYVDGTMEGFKVLRAARVNVWGSELPRLE